MSTRPRGAQAALLLALASIPLSIPLSISLSGLLPGPLRAMFLSEARADNVLAPIWSGVYLGFHGGANWSDVDTDFSSNFSATDATGGGHAGINFGLGGIVIGLEADANLDGVEATFATAGGGTGALSTDWNGTIRGRVGVPLGPVLLYATAGYAWTETSLSETSAAGGSFSSSHTFSGVVYGAGLESYVLPNLSLRLEALRYDYSADKLSISGAANSIQEIDPSDTVVRAGITFHLN